MKRAYLQVDVKKIPSDRRGFARFCKEKGYRRTGVYHAYADAGAHYIRIHAGNYLVCWDGELIGEAAEDDLMFSATINAANLDLRGG